MARGAARLSARLSNGNGTWLGTPRQPSFHGPATEGAPSSPMPFPPTGIMARAGVHAGVVSRSRAAVAVARRLGRFRACFCRGECVIAHVRWDGSPVRPGREGLGVKVKPWAVGHGAHQVVSRRVARACQVAPWEQRIRFGLSDKHERERPRTRPRRNQGWFTSKSFYTI